MTEGWWQPPCNQSHFPVDVLSEVRAVESHSTVVRHQTPTVFVSANHMWGQQLTSQTRHIPQRHAGCLFCLFGSRADLVCPLCGSLPLQQYCAGLKSSRQKAGIWTSHPSTTSSRRWNIKQGRNNPLSCTSHLHPTAPHPAPWIPLASHSKLFQGLQGEKGGDEQQEVCVMLNKCLKIWSFIHILGFQH